MSNIKIFPNSPEKTNVEPPKMILRPCDFGLMLAINNLELQPGTIEAYNRLVLAANDLKEQIDAGKVKRQNPIYAVSILGE